METSQVGGPQAGVADSNITCSLIMIMLRIIHSPDEELLRRGAAFLTVPAGFLADFALPKRATGAWKATIDFCIMVAIVLNCGTTINVLFIFRVGCR